MAQKKKDYTRLRNVAEEMFVRQGLAGKEIAELLEVSETTVSAWRKGSPGDQSWDDKKAELSLTPIRIKQLLLKEAEKIAKGEASSIDGDNLSKLMAAIDKLDKKVSVRMVVDVLKELDTFVAEIDPKAAYEMTAWHKKFINHRIAIEA